jgi:hypothetical protein
MLKITSTERTPFGIIKDLDHGTKSGLRLGLYLLGDSLKKTASKEMLKKNKLGKVYTIRTRSGRRRRHTSSARGQTAANLTGALRKSINFTVQGSSGLQFGAATPYARHLEIELDRPTLRNAMKANYRNGMNYIEQGIKAKIENGS